MLGFMPSLKILLDIRIILKIMKLLESPQI